MLTFPRMSKQRRGERGGKLYPHKLDFFLEPVDAQVFSCLAHIFFYNAGMRFQIPWLFA